nr:DNA helicase [Tanacetum cinerariifolium]
MPPAVYYGLLWEKTNEFRNTALTQLEKQPPDILTYTQAPGTLEALDNVRIPYGYGYDVPSIGPSTGVSILPFGGVSASKVVYGTQAAKLYLNVYQKYRHGCKEVFREGPIMISNGIPGIGGRRSVNVRQTTTVSSCNLIHDNGLRNTRPSTSHGGRNARGNPDVSLTTGEATCSRGIGGRRSNFIRNNGLRNTSPSTSYGGRNVRGNPDVSLTTDVRNTGPSTLRAGRNARGNPDVSLTTGEATCSRGIGGCRSNFIRDNDVRNTDPSTSRAGRNARGNPNVSLKTGGATCFRGIGRRHSNFIPDNDVRNTDPSTLRAGRNARGNPDASLNVRNTSRGGRNTRVNPDVGLTTAQASCSSGVTRHYLVRRRPSTRGPTVGSTSASGVGTSYTYTNFGDSDQHCRQCGGSFWYNAESDIPTIKGPNIIYVVQEAAFICNHRVNHLNMTTRYKCKELNILEFKIYLYNGKGAHGYEFPRSNTLGAMGKKNHNACLLQTPAPFSLAAVRFAFQGKKQNDIQADYLSGLYDAISRGERDGYEVGRRIILIIFFTGGPQYMYAYYPDALAICKNLGNQQFFITFTCNVNWPEIKRFMAQYPELTISDRANVVCRVFEQKIQSFVTFLKEERIFGNVPGVLYTVEFQKRGLPYCHALLWVDSESKIKSVEDVDQHISAELPDPKIDPDGYNIVSETIMHDPCEAASMKASCMKGNKCGKSFPNKFNSKTFFDENGHVHYQRRDTSITSTRNQFKLDNNYVVSYNRDLLIAFRAHINVEYCGWSMLIKYLFKYISKGTERIFARVSRLMGKSSTEATPSREMVDDIHNYVEGRFICAHEAYWRILKFNIHHREPVVQILVVHLEDMQRITFGDKDRLRSVVDLPGKKKITLTEWFAYKANNETGRHLSYLEFP